MSPRDAFSIGGFTGFMLAFGIFVLAWGPTVIACR